MIDSIAIGISGMKAQQQVVEVLSSNIANVNTPSYKRIEPQLKVIGFSSLLGEGDEVLAQGQDHGGVQFLEARRSMDVGGVKKTDRTLDLAIRGDGFFPVTRPDGVVVYTRNGDFHADGEGYLVDSNGYRLASEIQLPREAELVRISTSGQVTAVVGGKEESAGQIDLVKFAAPELLAYDDGGVYRATVASGEPESVAIADGGVGTLVQGFLETSNVRIVDEFVTLVVAQRAYEASAKMVQAADEMAGLANGLLKG